MMGAIFDCHLKYSKVAFLYVKLLLGYYRNHKYDPLILMAKESYHLKK